MVVQEDVCIPDRCEYNVNTRVEFRRTDQNKDDCSPLWMSESEVLRDGVHIPRTLVTDKLEDVTMRVLNVSGEPMHYKAGHPLAELHPVVEVLGTVPN